VRRLKLTGAICGALVALIVAAPAAFAVGGSADWMYEPTSIAEIHLELPQASISALESEPKEYVEGSFSLAETDGTPGTAGTFSAPLTVGIELKGNLGSLRSVNEKAAFKIKFNKFVTGQSFLGLEKMTLNNMVQDPSMVHETTTYEAFHDMGVPAPHTGFAYLTINGKSYGLHLNIETQDAQSLENEFGTPFAEPQHLYAGEYGADVSNEPLPSNSAVKKWEALEVAEGKKSKKEDLAALLAAVEKSGEPFATRMASVADLTEMTKDWLVEKYVGNWDGYAGQSPDYYHPNNYYLYSDPRGTSS
jgi:spore coat protein CotH